MSVYSGGRTSRSHREQLTTAKGKAGQVDVTQLIRKLTDFDASAIVTVGDAGGWSNIESVIEDSACVKIVMSDNVIFSDDRPAEEQGMAALQSGEAPSQHGQPAICAEWVSNSRCAFFSNIYCLRDKACVDTRKQQA